MQLLQGLKYFTQNAHHSFPTVLTQEVQESTKQMLSKTPEKATIVNCKAPSNQKCLNIAAVDWRRGQLVSCRPISLVRANKPLSGHGVN